MAPGIEYPELIQLLQEQGHSADEIEKILERVRQYEKETQLDSIMDSIGSGQLSLADLVKEALEG